MPTLVACLSARNHIDRSDRVPTCLATRKAIRGRKRQGNQQLTRAAAAQMCPSTANSGLTLFMSWRSLIEQALFWADQPQTKGASLALTAIYDRLLELEVSEEGAAAWLAAAS